jgi:hypothetical protein
MTKDTTEDLTTDFPATLIDNLAKDTRPVDEVFAAFEQDRSAELTALSALDVHDRVARLERQLAKVARESGDAYAFLQSHLVGQKPPLAGVELPTKAWVDESIRRVATRWDERIRAVEVLVNERIAGLMKTFVENYGHRARATTLRDRLRKAWRAFGAA